MFARRRHNRLTLANRGFQFGIGIIQQLIKRFLPKLSGRFWRRIIGYRRPDNAVVIRLIIGRVNPTQGWLPGCRFHLLQAGVIF